jgi:phosphonate transport system ATP-binding protein
MAQAVEIREEAIGYRGRTVLRAVDFRIEPGERVVIVGRSGAGKSTLLGRIYERASAESALIPQSSALVGPLNVFHNVYMGRLDREPTWRNLVNLVWPLAPCLAEIRTILEIVDLRDQIFEKAGRLSGGQQQRTSIARAMFNGRPILIGDEPVSALDRVQGANLLQELARRHETLILALHDIPLALAIATRVMAIEGGRIALDAPAAGLQSRDLAPFFES